MVNLEIDYGPQDNSLGYVMYGMDECYCNHIDFVHTLPRKINISFIHSSVNRVYNFWSVLEIANVFQYNSLVVNRCGTFTRAIS